MKMSFKKNAFLRCLIFTSLILFSTKQLMAQDEIEYKNMEQMLGSIRLEKKQIESMIDMMIASGRLSKAEGNEARRSIASIKEDDLENMKSRLIAEAKSRKDLDR